MLVEPGSAGVVPVLRREVLASVQSHQGKLPRVPRHHHGLVHDLTVGANWIGVVVLLVLLNGLGVF